MRVPFLLVCLAAVVATCPPALAAVGPRLAVVISVDQMRGDYLERFAPYFGEGGFRRFRDGTWFEQCFYRHAVTKTGPGHSVMLTGVHADVHGIIANDWRLRTWPAVEEVNCVEDREAALVGLPPRAVRSPGGRLEAKSGRSPRQLLAPTVGDRLKERFGACAKVFAVGGKDRSAILMGGRRADGAYWTGEGRVVTSTYYRSTLPPYLEAFNAEQHVAKRFGDTWDRLLDPAVYETVQGADDAPGEADKYGLARTFPKRVDGGRAEISPDFLEAFDHTPWSNDLIADLARAVMVNENLGEDDGAPDLLLIAFSQPDKIGHAYGPDSHEVMDSFVRLDRTLAELFAFIDRRVGLAHCVFVLTADHGVAPLPERQQAVGVPAGRVRGAELDRAVFAALDARFGPLEPGLRWAARDGLGYHVNPAASAARDLTPEVVAAQIAAALRSVPEVAAAFTREEMLADRPAGEIAEAMRLSYHRERSPDVVCVLKPFFMDRSEPTGTTHGQPYAYDQHVPLAWFGAGIAPARRAERVGVDDLAPTLAALLGVPAPGPGSGRRLF